VRRRRPKTFRSRCLSPAKPAAAQTSPYATTTALHPSALPDSLTRIEAHLYQRKKNQTSSPMRATTIRIATTKKTKSVAILLRNGSKKGAH
jgi:hypothetical protein